MSSWTEMPIGEWVEEKLQPLSIQDFLKHQQFKIFNSIQSNFGRSIYLVCN